MTTSAGGGGRPTAPSAAVRANVRASRRYAALRAAGATAAGAARTLRNEAAAGGRTALPKRRPRRV